MRIILLLLAILFTYSNVYAISAPIAIDSRIKTYIYNENEVFRIVVNYGYQTSVEFAEGEEIQTISVGNNYLWQLTPIGKRLFVKPLEDNIITNMTILTTLRSYQFELQSKSMSNSKDEDLVFVIRFFYPNDEATKAKIKLPEVVASPDTQVSTIQPFNFSFTQEGSKSISPLKIFDDGINTFFKFPKSLTKTPLIYDIGKGDKTMLELRQKGEFTIVNTVSSKFLINLGDKSVTVYNENYRGD